MKKLVFIIWIMYSGVGFTQNSNLKNEFTGYTSKDSIYFFPVWEVKNDKLYSVFDKIIEKNKKCLKRKKWSQVDNDYFFKMGVYNHSNANDSCNTFEVNITVYAGTQLIEFFIMSAGKNPKNEVFSGVIKYKGEIFMILNNPSVNYMLSFISKTNKTDEVLIKDKSYINIKKDETVSVYKLEYVYLYKNGNFKLIKKGCCP